MKRFQLVFMAWGFLLLAGYGAGLQAETSETGKFPEYNQVLELIRSHLVGVNEEELNRAAVRGLVAELGAKAELVAGNEEAREEGGKTLLSKKEIFDSGFAYLRVGEVARGLAAEMKSALVELGAANQVRGLVIDLRYAEGEDYAAVVEAADSFFATEQLLLTWDDRKGFSREKQEANDLPLAVLINGETRGAAEALAAVLKQAGGLLIGERTAGLAHVTKEYPLSHGYRLRLAGGVVQAGEAHKLTGVGVGPDIAIQVSREDEKVYFDNAYAVLPRWSGQRPNDRTAQVPPRRMNEAELVRRQREGFNLESSSARPEAETKPVVTDPSLGRALDFLKGMAALQKRS
jgi:hypothetical protein